MAYLYVQPTSHRSFTQLVSPFKAQPSRRLKHFTLNFGPQHPAAHGILRIVMQVSGEIIQQADAQFGLLHRGSEKLSEARNFLQVLPYFDRFDYVANLYQEHAYCLSVEALHDAPQSLPAHTLAFRTLFDELNRVANHLLTLSAVTMDMGAMAPIFWAFEEREQIMEFFERASGARMHTALYKPFGFDSSALTRVFFRDLARFINRSARALSGAFLGLLNNRALKSRYASVGQLGASKAAAYGITGIIARSTGLFTDLRLQTTVSYGAYASLSLKTFLGRRGDNLDRFILRVKETVEAFRLLSQLIKNLTPRGALYPTPSNLSAQVTMSPRQSPFALRRALKPRQAFDRASAGARPLHPATQVTSLWPQSTARGRFSGMEELISHFRTFSEGLPTPPGLAYREVESPKGFVGVFLVADGSSRPVRMKLRTPVAHNLNLIPTLSPGTLFGDFVATFCSLDVVLGEIDR